MNISRKQITVFLIGLLSAILLLEAGLRLGGFLYQRGRGSSAWNPDFSLPESRTILCLGNSWTEGGGAPAGQSYPDDLQHLFDNELGKEKVVVINGGFGNENTAELLDKLESTIKRIRPELIILQTGQANLWNHHRYSDYVERERRCPPSPACLMNDFLYHSRIYRLLCLLRDNMMEKEHVKASGYVLREQVCAGFAAKLQALDKSIIADRKKTSEAIDCFKSGISLYPDDSRNYDCIGLIYFLQDDHEEALKWFVQAVESNYDLEIKGGNKGYEHIRLLRDTYKGARNNEINEKINGFIKEFEKNSPESSENLLFLSKKDISDWVGSDTKEIIRIIRDKGKGIKIILQNYPFDPKVGKREVDSVLRKVATDLNIPFVDNERVFMGMMESGARREDYFSQDNHCNAKGYEIMARNVYDKIMKEGFLKSGGEAL
ncbi:MAG: SGNH/GDSL hydrolase family protein [Candidatus Omnitrophica bacterium]|nr:SGNH/GDSL hydrolase family protein [Candidatus Omnitrophota bacterium]MDD5770893.1 SGNH/GDSL hydrolase family protein [Candidatus Omnitrophota bacterium]